MHPIQRQILDHLRRGAALAALATSASACDNALSEGRVTGFTTGLTINLDTSCPGPILLKTLHSHPFQTNQRYRSLPKGDHVLCMSKDMMSRSGMYCKRTQDPGYLKDFVELAMPDLTSEVHGGCGPLTTLSLSQCCYSVQLVPDGKIRWDTLGRPFIVQGMARSAAHAQTQGWRSPGFEELEREAQALPDELRQQIAARWAINGCHEHASIASFGRSLLELMHLGAPRALIEATTRAIADESTHAADCFGVASAYAGYPLGPLTVDITDSLARSTDPEAILRALIHEGCIGESLAALQAARELGYITPEATRRVVHKIHEDELQHALLAWQTLGWMLTAHPHLLPAAQAAFCEWEGDLELTTPAMTALDAEGLPCLSERALCAMAHGDSPDELTAHQRLEAFKTLIQPCAQATLWPAQA